MPIFRLVAFSEIFRNLTFSEVLIESFSPLQSIFPVCRRSYTLALVGVCQQSVQPDMGTSHTEHAKEVTSQFFIAFGNTAKLFEATEESLHHITILYALTVIPPQLRTIGFGRYDRLNLAQGKVLQHMIG